LAKLMEHHGDAKLTDLPLTLAACPKGARPASPTGARRSTSNCCRKQACLASKSRRMAGEFGVHSGQRTPVLKGPPAMKVFDPATLAGTRVHARYCEGVHCCKPDDEVRVYPILFNVRSARVILCRPCWEQENRHRRRRGKELGVPSTGRRGTGRRLSAIPRMPLRKQSRRTGRPRGREQPCG
jgi:hypothetical protein